MRKKLKKFIIRRGSDDGAIEISPGEYGEVDFAALKEVMLDALHKSWGPRCVVLDTDEFDDLVVVGDPDAGRCPCCLVYEKFDKFWEYFSPDGP